MKGIITPPGQGAVFSGVAASSIQDFFPFLLHHIPALLNSFYTKSDSTCGIVHALLKWYSYLQYLQKQSLPSLAFRQTHTQTHARNAPSLYGGVKAMLPKVRQLLEEEEGRLFLCVCNSLKRSMGVCIWPSQC